jgi:hypothetical protein
MQHRNRIKDKNYMTISKDAEKNLDKLQHSLLIKVLKKLGMEEASINIIKAICGQLITGIILNMEKIKPFFYSSDGSNKARCSLLPILFNIVLFNIVHQKKGKRN